MVAVVARAMEKGNGGDISKGKTPKTIGRWSWWEFKNNSIRKVKNYH